ncbi:hypothetical protein OPV22_027134 [Ensete ventricosum]|uniref:Uncharacterized protein n=1 Tax=Ensete ventricosum TaxID=4639 RepID=A0AAV8P2Q0_ENSVE|nr:hypothetical protein OPV22_027134 [Ensete ventricosum]
MAAEPMADALLLLLLLIVTHQNHGNYMGRVPNAMDSYAHLSLTGIRVDRQSPETAGIAGARNTTGKDVLVISVFLPPLFDQRKDRRGSLNPWRVEKSSNMEAVVETDDVVVALCLWKWVHNVMHPRPWWVSVTFIPQNGRTLCSSWKFPGAQRYC